MYTTAGVDQLERDTAGMDQLERDSAGQEPAGKAQLDRDQLYRTRQVLDRKGFYVYKYQLATQVE